MPGSISNKRRGKFLPEKTKNNSGQSKEYALILLNGDNCIAIVCLPTIKEQIYKNNKHLNKPMSI